MTIPDLLLESFRRNGRVNDALLSALTPADLDLSDGRGGWTVGQHLGHLAHFRPGWLSLISPADAEGLPEVVEGDWQHFDLAERDPSLATALEVAQHHPDDPGVVVAILLNRVDLAPGQAIHLPAGNVHAYLHGLGVEVMAASDNVLRGGLTPKHVDVPELRRVVTFEALPVPSTEPERVADSVVAFRPPFEEFELLQATLEDDAVHGLDVHGPGIAVVTRGTARLALAGQEIELGPGEAVFLPAAETASGPLAVRAAAGAPATVHVAGLPRG